MLPDCDNTLKELKYTVKKTNMKDYLEFYFSEFLIMISIINLVLLGYLVFYLMKHKKLHIPHKEQPTPFTPHKKEVEKEWKRRCGGGGE